MPKVGSAIIFLHEHYAQVRQPFPVSFVQAISLDDLRPVHPNYHLEEKTVCEATVLGRKYRCFLLVLEPARSLKDQLFIVHHDRVYLEERAVRCTAALREEVVDSESEGVPDGDEEMEEAGRDDESQPESDEEVEEEEDNSNGDGSEKEEESESDEEQYRVYAPAFTAVRKTVTKKKVRIKEEKRE